jgi:hypothetical protein
VIGSPPLDFGAWAFGLEELDDSVETIHDSIDQQYLLDVQRLSYPSMEGARNCFLNNLTGIQVIPTNPHLSSCDLFLPECRIPVIVLYLTFAQSHLFREQTARS